MEYVTVIQGLSKKFQIRFAQKHLGRTQPNSRIPEGKPPAVAADAVKLSDGGHSAPD
jgi:hypothetical protein